LSLMKKIYPTMLTLGAIILFIINCTWRDQSWPFYLTCAFTIILLISYFMPRLSKKQQER